MKQLKLYFIPLFLLMWSFVFSQEHINYSINEGLPSNHVYRITQDNEGYIWIITDKGVSKFDGKTFKNFTTKNGLPTNDIWHLKITSDNKIWYFSKSNALGYIFNDTVYAFSSSTNRILFPRYISHVKDSIAFNDGEFNYILKDSFWLRDKKHVSNSKTWVKQKVFHHTVTSHGFNFSQDSILLYKNKESIFFPLKDEVIKNYNKREQINDSLFIVWGNKNYIISNFNTEETKQFSFESQSLPKNQSYFRIHSVNNKIQFTGSNFVAYLSSDLQLKDIIEIPEKLNSHFSFVDKTGNIWSATFNKGVYMLPKEKQYGKTLAKNKKIQHLKLVNDTIYAGIYQEGFFSIEDTLHPILENKNFQFSISPINDSKTILFSSKFDIHAYKNNKLKKLSIPREKGSLKNAYARKIIEFNGFLYANNSYGVAKINPKDFTIDTLTRLYSVSSFSKTAKHLFVGNQGGLLELVDSTYVKLTKNRLFTKPVLNQEHLNENEIVVGTDGFGAYVTNGKSANLIKGTCQLSIQDIFIDSKKSIWLATEHGVHKASKKDNDYAITRSFYESDGLISNSINSLVVQNDSLVVGSDIGISILSLNEERINQLQKIYVKSLVVNSKKMNRDSVVFPFEKNNHVSISFGVLDFSHQHDLTFQYRLKPIQTKWSETVTPDINFSELAPENYVLEFKVKNHHNNELIKSVSIEITALWYQKLSFQVFAIILSAFVIAFVTWRLSKKIQEKKNAKIVQEKKIIELQLKALRSQMNPHFVFNSLASIQFYINENNFKASDIYLKKFSKLIRQFFELSKTTEIRLNSEIKLIENYLDIEKLRFRDKFDYQINIDKKINGFAMKLPTMLLQPIVENAINHGVFNKIDNGIITVSFIYLTESSIQIEIIDDGVGFVNTKEQALIREKSSNILEDRLKFLNQSGEWKVTYSQEELYPDLDDKGNKSTFIITKL